MNRLLMESLSGSISSQVGHTLPQFSGVVPSLALHYGADWVGDEAYKRIKKRKKLRKAYDKVFNSKNPKQRPGKFASDLTSIGGTAAGLRAAKALTANMPDSKRAILAKLAGGVAGHTAGRLVGNTAGRKINKVLYGRRKKVKESDLREGIAILDNAARALHGVRKKLRVKLHMKGPGRTTAQAKKDFIDRTKRMKKRVVDTSADYAAQGMHNAHVYMDKGVAAAKEKIVEPATAAVKYGVRNAAIAGGVGVGLVGAGLLAKAGIRGAKALHSAYKNRKVAAAAEPNLATKLAGLNKKHVAAGLGALALYKLATRKRKKK